MADRFKQNIRPFYKEQKVWLDAKNLKTPYHSKFAPKREGPFKIKDVLGPLTFCLELPKRWEIHNVFHASLLLLFNATDVHRPSFTNLPPDLIDGEEEYEVESILKHQKRGQGYQYLVRWKGYSLADDKWEPAASITNADKILSEYKKKHKLK